MGRSTEFPSAASFSNWWSGARIMKKMDSSIDHRGLAKLCGIDGSAARRRLGARRGRAGPALPQGRARIPYESTRAALCILATLAAAISLGPPALASDPIARDIAAEIGLNYRGAVVASTEGESPVFDYDGDGDLDILLSTHGGSPWPLMQIRATAPSWRRCPGRSSRRTATGASPPISVASRKAAFRTGCRTSTALPGLAKGSAPRSIENHCSSSGQTIRSSTSPRAGGRPIRTGEAVSR